MSGQNPAVAPALAAADRQNLNARREVLLAIEKCAALVLPYAVLAYATIRSIRAFGTYNHDDHMYVPAATLFPHLALYREIPFVQTPLSIFVYASLNALVGPAFLYFAARLASIFLMLGTTVIGARTAYRLLPRRYVPWTVATLLLLNAHIFSNMSETANYALSLFFFSLASYLYVSRPRGTVWSLSIGLLMGLAASAKISFGAPAGAFALIFLIDRKWRPFTVHYLIACLAGSSPCIYYLLVDRWTFLFLNVDFHLLTNQFRGLGINDSATSVLKGAGQFLTFFIPSLGLIGIGFFLARKDRKTFRWPALPLSTCGKLNAARAGIVFAATLIAAIMPMTYFSQYWSSPALVLIVLSIATFATIADSSIAFRNTMMVGALILIGMSSARDIRALARDGMDNYAPVLVMRAHNNISELIGNALDKHPGCVTDILSASAIPALGSGVNLSPGSAAGEFLFRIDDILRDRQPEFRRYSDVTRYLGPKTALLTGYYGNREFEHQMTAYAVSHGFVRAGTFKYPKAPLSLYLPAGCRT